MSISPDKIPSVLGHRDTVSQDSKQSEIPAQKIIVERFPLIAGLFRNIGYVQTDPLPQHIAYLQESGLKGLEFVKIPVTSKTDRLYLYDSIKQLMSMCGVNWDDLEELIDIYNGKCVIPEILKVRGYDMGAIRSSILSLFNIATYFTDRHNIEFLSDPEELLSRNSP